MLDNLKEKYANIILGLQAVQQTETTHQATSAPSSSSSSSSSTTSTTTIMSVAEQRPFLMTVCTAINKIASEIFRGPHASPLEKKEVDNQWKRGIKKEFETILSDAAMQLDATAAMEVFKVQVMRMMRLADECHILQWFSTFERRSWIDTLECSMTFAQIVFYTHRLRYYQQRAPLEVPAVSQ